MNVWIWSDCAQSYVEGPTLTAELRQYAYDMLHAVMTDLVIGTSVSDWGDPIEPWNGWVKYGF